MPRPPARATRATIHVMTSAAPARFTVATYNIHKGFSQLTRRMVIHELRERLHGLAADILFLQEVQGVHDRHAARYRDWPRQAAARVHRRQGVARGRVRQERRLPRTAITATRCCRAFRSSRRRTRTSRRTLFESRGMLHCEIELGPRHAARCIASTSTSGLFERGRQWQIRALCRAHPRDGADGRAADHRRRFQRLAAQGRPHAARGARRRRGVRAASAAARRARFRR